MIATIPRQLWAFIKNTMLEAMRNKILYAIFFFAAMAIGATSAFGALSLHQNERVFNTLVLAANVFFLSSLAIYQGVSAIQREIESRTIFTVLSKPVERPTFIVGKYLGSFAMITVCLLILFVLKLGVASFLDYSITHHLFAAYYGVFLQLSIVVALAIFFSSFSTQLLSALFAFSMFLVGNLTPQLRDAVIYFGNEGNPISHIISASLYIIPDLEKLNLSFELTHRVDISTTYLWHASAYSFVVVVILLIGAHFVFRNRDFY